jgi:selenocysteine-specific elongation factor
LLAQAGYVDSPIFPVSSRTGEGISVLADHLRDSARVADAARGARPAEGQFRLPIDRAFSLPGIGLVVTGTVASGEVATGDRLLVSPRGIEVRVRGMHAQNRPIEHAQAGERCALNLAGNFPEGGEPGRGNWVIAPALHAPVSRIDVSLTVSRAAPAALRDGLPVHVHIGTEDLVGRAAVLGARNIATGERGFVQLDLERPIGALWGDRVVLRDHGARHTLGGGRVVDPFPPRRGRSRPERLTALDALAEADAGDALLRLVDAAGMVELGKFGLARNLPPPEVDLLAEAGGRRRIGTGATALAASPQRLQEIAEAIAAALAEVHRAQPDSLGPTRGALFRRLCGMAPEAALDAALADLVAAGRIVRDGAVLRLAEHKPKLSREDEKLWRQLHPLLGADDLRPPRVRELSEALGLQPEVATRFLKRMERFGRVAAVAPNRYFLPETVARLSEVARELAEESAEAGFTAAAFRDRSGIGRNLTIEVLEYLDAIGVTRRVGEGRVVVRSGPEVFG